MKLPYTQKFSGNSRLKIVLLEDIFKFYIQLSISLLNTLWINVHCGLSAQQSRKRDWSQETKHTANYHRQRAGWRRNYGWYPILGVPMVKFWIQGSKINYLLWNWYGNWVKMKVQRQWYAWDKCGWQIYFGCNYIKCFGCNHWPCSTLHVLINDLSPVLRWMGGWHNFLNHVLNANTIDTVQKF